MRDEPLLALEVEVAEVLAAAFVLDAAVDVELALHVGGQVVVTTVADAFQLAELALAQEREGIFHIGGAATVVASLVLAVLTELELLATEPEVGVPLHPSVAPVLVPLVRFGRMAEELDFHLLELAGSEGEVPRRDLVAEALADLGDTERNFDPRAVADVLEVDKNALSSLGPEERRVLLVQHRADDGLEHQVELARVSQLANLFTERTGNLARGSPVDRLVGVKNKEVAPIGFYYGSGPRVSYRKVYFADLGSMFLFEVSGQHLLVIVMEASEGRNRLRVLPSPLLVRREAFRYRLPWTFLDVRLADLVGAESAFARPAVHHHVVEQIEVAGGFPDLRVHNDRAVEADHLVFLAAGADRRAAHHVVPPGVLDVALELHAEWAVIPEPADSAVDLAALKYESAPLAQRDDPLHHTAGDLCHGPVFPSSFRGCPKGSQGRQNLVLYSAGALSRQPARARRPTSSGGARSDRRRPHNGCADRAGVGLR